MSTATARAPLPVPTRSPARTTRPAARPTPRTPLRLVAPPRSTAARAPFVVVVVGLLVTGLLGLLALNTVLAQDAFRLHSLQAQGTDLTLREQVLQRSVDDMSSPAALARRAAALGMVPGGAPVFLRLPDGAVLGTPGKAPKAAPKPAPKPAAHPAAPAPTAGANATPTTAAKTTATKAAAAKTAAMKAAATKPTAAPQATGKATTTTKPTAKAGPAARPTTSPGAPR